MLFTFAIPLLIASVATPAAAPSPVRQSWAILKEAAQDKSASRRAKAIHALKLVKSRLARSMAEDALTDSDKDVRSEAAATLGEMRATASIPKLHACLDDKELQVVLACTNSLYLLKDPMAYQVYYAILSGDRKSSKGLVQSQLATLRDRKQLEKLAFETGIGFVPYGGIGWQAIKTITRDDSSPVRALAAARLATDPDPKSAQAMAEFLTDKKTHVREAVVESIAQHGDPAMLNTLIPLLEDDNDGVRCDAAAAVIFLSGRRTPPAKTSKWHSTKSTAELPLARQ